MGRAVLFGWLAGSVLVNWRDSSYWVNTGCVVSSAAILAVYIAAIRSTPKGEA